MNTIQLTIDLPEAEARYLERFAQRHKVSVSQLIDHYAKQLQITEKYSHHPDIKKFAGIVPNDIEAQKAYYEAMEEKHK
ncbi:MAG: DUF6364 family protein [bacterium]